MYYLFGIAKPEYLLYPEPVGNFQTKEEAVLWARQNHGEDWIINYCIAYFSDEDELNKFSDIYRNLWSKRVKYENDQLLHSQQDFE